MIVNLEMCVDGLGAGHGGRGRVVAVLPPYCTEVGDRQSGGVSQGGFVSVVGSPN